MKKCSIILFVHLATQCYLQNLESLNNPWRRPKPSFKFDFTDGLQSEYGDDRCEFYNPIVPDFSRPGQRVSVTKCYEYIWEIQVRIDRDRKCNRGNSLLDGMKPKTNLVIDGLLAIPKQFPHMGAVGWKSSELGRLWKFMCGCTLISSKFVLTAAHCSSAQPKDATIDGIIPKIVRFGDKDINDWTREDHDIVRIIVHDKYASPSKYYDIALFELDEIVEFSSYIQPSCLWTEDLDKVPIKNTTVAGWGVTKPNAREGSPDLLFAPLNIIDSKLCDKLLETERNRHWQGLEDHQFCAGRLEGGIDTCQGDSGGPLQIEIPLPKKIKDEDTMHYIVGVTSFGKKCAQENMPGVYSKVSYFADWIEKHVWG